MEESAKASRVKVASVLSVVSSKPIGPGIVHKLPKMDQQLAHMRVQIVFYYDSNPFNRGPMSDQLDNLRVSLSDLLNNFPVVTGRLTRDPGDGGWQIKCNDAGVRMLRAKVSTTLNEWLRSADASEEQDLMVWEEMPQDPSFWSPFRIQINNFECGGLAVAFSCSHMHVDITSATLLMKSWADVHRGQPLLHRPVFDLPTPDPIFHSARQGSSIPQKLATLTMKFSAKSVERCLSEARRQSPSATPFDALTALLWSRIASCHEPESDGGGNLSLSICVDLRNQGPHPLPFGFFGNALRFSSLSMNASKLIGDGIGKLADSIHRHVEDMKRDADSCEAYGAGLLCINMEHMVDAETGQGLMYAAIFDAGDAPLHVSYNIKNVEGHGLIIVAPAREPGSGRAVTVTLPPEQISKLAKDEAITELKPSMILSGTSR